MTYPPQQPDPYGGAQWSQGGYPQPGYPQPGYPQPGYPQPGYPGGWYPGGEPPKKKTGLIVGVSIAVVLLLGGAFAFTGLVEPGFLTSDDEPVAQWGSAPTTPSAPPVTTPSAPSAANLPPRPSLSTPGPGSTPESGPKLGTSTPKLRKLKAVSVVGQTWSGSDETYTMAFKGWPFAFRTGKTWGCIRGTHDAVPNAVAWFCRDEQNPEPGQRMTVILQECKPCGAGDRARLNREWLDEPDKAARHGDRTYYVETKSNEDGRYQVDLSHYFGDKPDAKEPTWQVGVFIESPQASKAVVQKALNDIVSQTP